MWYQQKHSRDWLIVCSDLLLLTCHLADHLRRGLTMTSSSLTSSLLLLMVMVVCLATAAGGYADDRELLLQHFDSVYSEHSLNEEKGKGRYSSSWEPHLRATGRHLPYGITQCYLPPDTSERAPPNPSHAGWCLIYLPRGDGRLSWPSWLDPRPGVEPATFRSQVRRSTTAPTRQP